MRLHELQARPEQGDMFSDEFADKDHTAKRTDVISTKGDTAEISLPNQNSRGGIISPVKQVVDRFWKWFGHSEAVDNNGRPLVFYHGTASDFTEFKTKVKTHNNYGLLGDIELVRHAIFVTPDLEFASHYTNKGDTGGENIITLYAKAENPFDMRNGITEQMEADLDAVDFNTRVLYNVSKDWELFDDEIGEDFVAALKQAGYDSAIISEFNEFIDDGDNHDVWVFFNGNQLKSVFNKGTYNQSGDMTEHKK